MAAEDMVGLLSKIAMSGWDGLDNAEALMRAAGEREGRQDAEKRAADVAVVRAALDTEAGHALMAWLMKKTVLRPPSDIEFQAAKTAEAYAIAKARREGQNGIVFMLLEALSEQPIDKEDGTP